MTGNSEETATSRMHNPRDRNGSWMPSGLTISGMSAPLLPKHQSLRIASLRCWRAWASSSRLNLNGSSITDAGLGSIGQMRDLDALFLVGTRVGDAGLANVKGLGSLTLLNLDKTRVTDAGLANLEDLRNLERLDLSDTPVTDAGLKILGSMPRLRTLAPGWHQGYRCQLGPTEEDARSCDPCSEPDERDRCRPC